MKPGPHSVDRIVVIPEENLSKSYGAILRLIAVMMHPENDELIEKYTNSLIRYHLNRLTQEERSKFFSNQCDWATEIYDDKLEHIAILEKSITSRQRGLTGSALDKGAWCGHSLIHFLKPSGGSFEGAYVELRRRSKERQDTSEHDHTPEDSLPINQLANPSISTLKKIWREYRHVSHFWAAELIISQSIHGSLFTLPITTNELILFIRTAARFRDWLANAVKVSTGQYIIENPFLLWDIVKNDDGIRYDPADYSLENLEKL